MIFYCHRINTIKELKQIPKHYGIEVDLRDDKNGDIILVHDPLCSGEKFDDFLKFYDKKSIILNIKSERIEYKIIELLKKYNIIDYFFLDCSFPMIYNLNKIGEKNIAIRFSEYESVESVLLVKNMVKQVWIDCFNIFPLNKDIYTKLKDTNLKLCLVSPELQNYNIDYIFKFKQLLKNNNYILDGICTKIYNINKW